MSFARSPPREVFWMRREDSPEDFGAFLHDETRPRRIWVGVERSAARQRQAVGERIGAAHHIAQPVTSGSIVPRPRLDPQSHSRSMLRGVLDRDFDLGEGGQDCAVERFSE